MNKIKFLILVSLFSVYAGPQEDLWRATEAGDKAKVEAALNAGAQIDKQIEKGISASWTALIWATQLDHIETVKLLLEKNADPDKQTNTGATALFWAADNGNTEIARLLLEKNADPDKQIEAGWTALMKAADNGHTEIVRLLLEKGATIDTQDKFGWTALMKAARDGHTEIARLLLEKNADPDWNALMTAAQNGHTEIVRLLLEKGATIDTQDKFGWTALMKAARDGHTEIAKLLINAGASIPESLKDNADIQEALKFKKSATKAFIDLIKKRGTTKEAIRDRIRGLMKEGYRISTLRDEKEENILHAALVDSVNPEVRELLIKLYPALLLKPDRSKTTPLQIAIGQGPELTKLVIDGMAYLPTKAKQKMFDALTPKERRLLKALGFEAKSPN